MEIENDRATINDHFGKFGDAIRDNVFKYYDTLLHFNGSINLIAASTVDVAVCQHFADSLFGLEIAQKNRPFDKPVYDLGSGNGFPGLILAITKPDVAVNLVERDLRKSEFLKHVVGELKLNNCKVLNQTIESLDKNLIELGITRALGSLGTVTIQLTPHAKPGASIFHFKSDSWTSELASCPAQVFTKWELKPLSEYSLPNNLTTHTIISSVRLP